MRSARRMYVAPVGFCRKFRNSSREMAGMTSPSRFAKHQRAVLAAERDAIAQRNVDLHCTRGVGDVVEITVRIGIVEINRRMKSPPIKPDQRGRDARGATGT